MANRLRFDSERKKPPSKLIHITADTPIDALAMQFHREMKDSDDNAGTSAADASMMTAEILYRTEKLRHERTTVKNESNTVNPTSKYYQKKAIKQEYAKSKHTSAENARASEIASKAVKTAAEKAKQVVTYVANHKGAFIVLGCILAVLLMLTSMISSCSVLIQGAVGSLGMTTYASTEEDMREVEAEYRSLEAELQEKLDNYEDLNPSYDEYRINAEVLGHDPFVLTSILTSVFGEYTLDDVEMFLHTIFNLQYRLTETVQREIRYRYINGERRAYWYKICTVTLTCTPMEDLAQSLLTEEQYKMYEIYMPTSGNNPELFDETE